MFLEVPYKSLLQSHPGAVQEALGTLRKGKSRHKADPPESFTWGFSWCVTVEGFSFEDLLSGRVPAVVPEEAPEERVRAYARRCSVCVQVRKGRAYAYSAQLPEVPEAILDQYRVAIEVEAGENARVEALSPEEREREIQGLLSQLRKDPGFMEISVPGELIPDPSERTGD
jgi:hypothetical protein